MEKDKDLIVLKDKNKLGKISKFNFFGRMYIWIKDSISHGRYSEAKEAVIKDTFQKISHEITRIAEGEVNYDDRNILNISLKVGSRPEDLKLTNEMVPITKLSEQIKSTDYSTKDYLKTFVDTITNQGDNAVEQFNNMEAVKRKKMMGS